MHLKIVSLKKGSQYRVVPVYIHWQRRLSCLYIILAGIQFFSGLVIAALTWFNGLHI